MYLCKNIPLIETNITCVFKRSNLVILPAKVRKRVSFFPEKEVSVGFGANSEEVVILNCMVNTLENKMIINNSGGIRIPAEIKRLGSLSFGDKFEVFVLGSEEGVLLKVRR